MNILVTGTSGFIGFHLSKKLLERGDTVIGVDCENDYYDVDLKIARREELKKNENFKFYKGNLENLDFLKEVFANEDVDRVCNLAAQAGVRYSLVNPYAYIQSNLVGFHNLLDLSKQHKVENFVYASSSSVYGNNKDMPFSVEDRVDTPISIYAATKKSNELIAYSYHHLYKMKMTGLRFFTVYGPYGRPDMAMYIFANKICNNEEIDVFNFGKMKRDFTFIDDIVDGVIKSIDTCSEYEVLNLGNNKTVELEYMIDLIEKNLGIKAIRNYIEIQPGDVPATWANIDRTKEVLGWEPKISIEEGVKRFVDWYKQYHKV